MVLYGGDQYFITRANVGPAIALGHKIDGLGCAAHKYNFRRFTRANKMLELCARPFKRIGCTGGQRMGCAVDVGVVLLIKCGGGVNDRAGFLGCGGVVQPDQFMAVNPLVQDGKIRLNTRHIVPTQCGVGRMLGGGVGGTFCVA